MTTQATCITLQVLKNPGWLTYQYYTKYRTNSGIGLYCLKKTLKKQIIQDTSGLFCRVTHLASTGLPHQGISCALQIIVHQGLWGSFFLALEVQKISLPGQYGTLLGLQQSTVSKKICYRKLYIYCFEAIARNIYSVFVIGKTVSWFTSVSIRHTEQSDVDLALYLIKSSFPIQILNTIFPPASINAAIKWPPMPGFVFFFFKFKTACFRYKRDSPLLVILSNPLRSK